MVRSLRLFALLISTVCVIVLYTFAITNSFSFCTVIGSKKQRKLFTCMKVYQTLKNYLTIVARCPNHKAAMYVMDSIIGWLRSVKEDKGTDWLVDYWSGER